MSLTDYPPVKGPSAEQTIEIMAGATYDESSFQTLTFSREFQERYGEPTLSVEAWKRLMDQGVPKIVPIYKVPFYQFYRHFGFLKFCRDVDNNATRSNYPPVGRTLMEAAFAQWLVFKFDRPDDEARDISYLLALPKANIQTEEQARDVRKKALESFMTQRFDQDVEEYWRAKPERAQAPGLDVTMVTDLSLATIVPDDPTGGDGGVDMMEGVEETAEATLSGEGEGEGRAGIQQSIAEMALDDSDDEIPAGLNQLSRSELLILYADTYEDVGL
ncbi:hypothetical protein PVAG01_05399 [Phlyctema vagabunda]|uniref:Uncharacterized protein n=1 Tax=Phlyctema vagabunda TaxID=108571 RepID=A0ABR4PKN6_9HELO